MVLQAVLWAWHGFIEQYRYGHPRYLTLGLFFQKGAYGYELTPRDEKEEAFEYLIKDALKKPRHYFRLHQKWRSDRQAMLKSAQGLEILVDQPFNRKKSFQAFQKLVENFYTKVIPAIIIEHTDVYTDKKIFEELAAELPDVNKDKIHEIVFAMTAPAGLSYVERENRDLMRATLSGLGGLKKKYSNFRDFEKSHYTLAKRFYKLSKDYFWIKNNYATTQVLTPDYFWKKAQAMARSSASRLRKQLTEIETRPKKVRQNQKSLRKKYRFSKRMDLIFRLLSEFTIWQDERKELVMQTSHYINNFCDWLGQETGYNSKYLKTLGLKEMRGFLKKGELPKLNELRSRWKFSVYVTERVGKSSKGYVISGQKSQQLFRLINRQMDVSEELQGVVASAPRKVIKGKAQVILDVSKQKFKSGRILVTTMTRPEFMPYVRKASGIITDEGGITTHAAIVSRELRIPCIIGTQQASKVLRNGDKVEMDLTSGKITIIK